jgi:transcriptional regulator GlxA family with amidase domain
MQERSVVVVTFDDFQMLDVAGPVEVLHDSSLLGATPPYRVTLASIDGRPVTSSSRMTLAVDVSLADFHPTAIDTLIIAGGFGVDAAAADPAMLTAVRHLAAHSRRIASVCTGALLLGAAGLLDGHRATTHWAACDLLGSRHRDVEVEPDQIFVRDRDRWTSAGVTAGMDLALAFVEDDHGPELARQTAAWLVMYLQRSGGQSQFSPHLRAQTAERPAIRELQDWLPDHLAEDLTVASLARRAAMSERTFARTFRAETGQTPAAHVEDLRVEAARRLLETTELTVAAVAASVGLGPETLHRVFRRRIGTTPDRYRRHFARQPVPLNTVARHTASLNTA